MRNKSIVLFVVLCMVSSLVFANEKSGKNQGTKEQKLEQGSKMVPYNKETVMTVKGKVSSIDIVSNKAMQEEGLHLRIETEEGSYIIHVCPKWYADKEKIGFEKDEEITVTGSEFEKDDAKNIYAATIITSSGTLELREEEAGKSLWEGRNKDSEKEVKSEEKKQKNKEKQGSKGEGTKKKKKWKK